MTGRDVPCKVRVLSFLRFADAVTGLAVPDEWDAVLFAWALFGEVACAAAIIEVPEMLIWAKALNTEAFSGKCIELFKFVVTMTHFVPARTV